MTDAGMKIEDDKVVTFHYRLQDSDGSFTESSEGKNPVTYMHGRGNIVRGLEKELRGRGSGEKLTVTVAPEEAYGLHDPDAVQRVPVKHLAARGKLVAGQMVPVNTNAGIRYALVLKVGHFNVDLDFNHPLAGRTLVFDIDIIGVRDATAEELEHGHAHGPEGHAHDHEHEHEHDHEHDHG